MRLMRWHEFKARLVRQVKRSGNRLGRRFGTIPRDYHFLNGREVHIRHRATRADEEVMVQCFWHRQYQIPSIMGELGEAVERFYADLVARGKKPLIIDGGANIGASAVWFATRYPGAHIVAVEPALDNCRLLLLNTRAFDVEILHAGLGPSVGTAILTDPGYGEWAYRTEAAGAGNRVRITTLEQILSEQRPGEYVPFILKLDIEGSEKDLFEDHHDVAGMFPVLMMELHDWMLPRGGTSQSFLRFHVRHGRDLLSRGENIFSIDYALLGAAHAARRPAQA